MRTPDIEDLPILLLMTQYIVHSNIIIHFYFESSEGLFGGWKRRKREEERMNRE